MLAKKKKTHNNFLKKSENGLSDEDLQEIESDLPEVSALVNAKLKALENEIASIKPKQQEESDSQEISENFERNFFDCREHGKTGLHLR